MDEVELTFNPSFYRSLVRISMARRPPVISHSGWATVKLREQIKHLYDQRRHGDISDANWARIEPDIIAAGREGRVTSSFDKYGNERRLI